MDIWYSALAAEDLINNSVCIIDSQGIRNIKHYSEIDRELFVLVSNLDHVDNVNTNKRPLHKGSIVRYLKFK